MLSGEGNKNGEKTIGLISKKATLHVQHNFFVHFLAVVLHDYNVKLPETSQLHVSLREMSYVFLFTIFSLPPGSCCHSFSPCIGGRQLISHVVTAVFFFFISRSRSLSPFLSLSFAGLPLTFSFSLSQSCSVFQICGHDN